MSLFRRLFHVDYKACCHTRKEGIYWPIIFPNCRCCLKQSEDTVDLTGNVKFNSSAKVKFDSF
jgi:hypothetical protein